MIRDYISHELQSASNQIEDLNRQERDAQRAENRQRRDEADTRARRVRENLLTELPPATTYEFLDVTRTANAINFRTLWQEKNRSVDCLQELGKRWREGSRYYRDIFESPKIDLAILPPYSFLIQFTFVLAQPYISRDEQDFYIIDNPVRKDKIFGLPYVASTSWKGSLRAALWQSGYKEESHPSIRHLFGNEKGAEDPNDLQAGCLHFYPTFFTSKSLEIINPQDHKLRVGKNPIPFESVPAAARGVFTLLYVPFDLISRDGQETRKQVAEELQLVAEGLQAMFRTYGFGAKTSSGFGLAREDIKGSLTIRTDYPPEPFDSFTQLPRTTEKIEQKLRNVLGEGEYEQ